MKRFKQFVYHGLGEDENNPKEVYNNLGTLVNNPWTNNLFVNYRQVSHLGIQGEPGTKFCLNGATADNAITIGLTGIYEIDLGGIGYISALRFLPETLAKYDEVPKNGRRLIVDFVYEGVL